MSERRDPEATIRRWLGEEVEHVSERAISGTIERLRTTDQPRMFVVNLPVPLAAALGLAVMLVASLGLWSGIATRPPVSTATPSPSSSPSCLLEIAASGANGTVFVGRGFEPDADVVLDIDRADGSQVTIRPTDLPGLHTDDQGRFGVTLYGSASDVGTDIVRATAGCTASLSAVTTASQLPPSCPPEDEGSMAFEDGPAYRAAVLVSHPVHWWHLDDAGADVIADSAGDADGAKVGSLLPVPATGASRAARFDGAGSFVRIPEISMTDFTLEAWVYLCGLVSNEDAIVGHGQGVPNVNFFEEHMRLFAGASGDDVVIATTAAHTGTWEHWAVERDAAGTRIYRNGVLDASGARWSDPFVIDEIGRGDVGVLKGLLDEVALYDRALTGDELLAHVTAAQQ